MVMDSFKICMYVFLQDDQSLDSDGAILIQVDSHSNQLDVLKDLHNKYQELTEEEVNTSCYHAQASYLQMLSYIQGTVQFDDSFNCNGSSSLSSYSYNNAERSCNHHSTVNSDGEVFNYGSVHVDPQSNEFDVLKDLHNKGQELIEEVTTFCYHAQASYEPEYLLCYI